MQAEWGPRVPSVPPTRKWSSTGTTRSSRVAWNKPEWKDTEVVFEISEKGGKTEVRFTHVGLVYAYECFDIRAANAEPLSCEPVR